MLPPIVSLDAGSAQITIVSNNQTSPLEIKVMMLTCCSCTLFQATTRVDIVLCSCSSCPGVWMPQ